MPYDSSAFRQCDSFVQAALPGKRDGEIVIGTGIAGVERESALPLRDDGLGRAFLRELPGAIESPVKLDSRDRDLLKFPGRYIHELGNVHCPVGGRCVLDLDRRAVVAVLVNMSEIHPGVR